MSATHHPVRSSTPPAASWQVDGCPHCHSKDVHEVLTLSDVPTQDGVLWPTREAALAAPTGDIVLAMCNSCGLVGNTAYESDKVDFSEYDVATDHSPLFQAYIDELARRLIDTHQLQGKRVLEIGCGRGYFLRRICDLGGGRGLGIDPSRVAIQGAEAHPTVRYLHEAYSERQVDEPFDFLACRLVLDELADQTGFLRTVRAAMLRQASPVAYFEVPNAAYTFANRIVWNLIYAHRIWYFRESLRALFENEGFEVLRVAPCWNDEYLGIEVRPGAEKRGEDEVRPARDFAEIHACIETFKAGLDSFRCGWRRRLEAHAARYSRIAMWGAGARAISFLSTMDVGASLVALVDINPRRQGRYLPKSGVMVAPPESLRALKPDLILISNPTYQAEIRKHATDLGLTCDFDLLEG